MLAREEKIGEGGIEREDITQLDTVEHLQRLASHTPATTRYGKGRELDKAEFCREERRGGRVLPRGEERLGVAE
jgi:hypothetical protein